MARVNTILTRARDTLSDETPTRWSTPRLLRILSEGQELIARQLNCVRSRHTIQLCDDYHTYKLDPTGIIATNAIPLAITAIINYKGNPLKFVITSVMDRIDVDWRTRECGGEVTHVIYNKQDPYIFRLYPMPESTELTGSETLNTANEPIADAATINEAITTWSNFDITTEKTPIKILIEYSYVPPPITTIADTNLLVSQHFDQALKHYVIGMALRDDKDTFNRQSAQDELNLFNGQMQEAAELVEADWTERTEERHYASVGYNAVITKQ